MDDKAQAARDALLVRIAERAPEATGQHIRDLAEAYALVTADEPKQERTSRMRGV